MKGQFMQQRSKWKRQRVDAKDFNGDKKNGRGGIKKKYLTANYTSTIPAFYVND